MSVMTDGIVFHEYNRYKDNTWKRFFKHFDWNDLEFLKLQKEWIIIKGKTFERRESFAMSKDDVDKLNENWKIYQQVGKIPNNVPLVIEPREKEAPVVQKRAGCVSEAIGTAIVIFIGLAIYGAIKGNPNTTGSYLGWKFTEEKLDDGRVLHEMYKNIAKTENSPVQMMIDCPTKGIAPADQIVMAVLVNDKVEITGLRYRRRSNSEVKKGIDVSSFHLKDIDWITPFEVMNPDQMLSNFGGSALVIIGPSRAVCEGPEAAGLL